MPVTRIAKTALLPYAAEQLFDLVNDIAAYPQYMDGCVAATVLLSTPEIVEARLELSRAGITQAFATRNRLQRPQSIDMELLEGPFTALSGRWQFLALAPEAARSCWRRRQGSARPEGPSAPRGETREIGKT